MTIILSIEFIQAFPGEKIDFVSYLPRCPEPAARGFSRSTGIPFEEIFYKITDVRKLLFGLRRHLKSKSK